MNRYISKSYTTTKNTLTIPINCTEAPVHSGDMVVHMRKVLVRYWPYRGVGTCASVQLIGIVSRILLINNTVQIESGSSCSVYYYQLRKAVAQGVKGVYLFFLPITPSSRSTFVPIIPLFSLVSTSRAFRLFRTLH